MRTRTLPLVGAAIAVIECRGRYLVSRRRAGDHLGGLWEFPGGKRRPGEAWRAGGLREGREELGGEGACLGRFAPIRFTYPDRRVRLELFRCRITDGTPRARRSHAIRWVTPAQLARLRVPPANQPFIRRLTQRASHA